jgi:hypothetical protein
MVRPLEAATANALNEPVIPLAAIVSLDIQDDPLLAWTGIGDLTFAAAATGDAALDGKTFKGIGEIIEIKTVSEGVGGSDGLEIAFPGVSLDNTMMKQVIRDRRRWQFKRALVWMMLLDPDDFTIAGKPFRIKTGLIDSMPFDENDNVGVIKAVIEGQQSYGNEPLNTRYSEQIDLNPNDTSQKYVYHLANMSAIIGKSTATELNTMIAIANSGGSSVVPGVTGSGGGYTYGGGGNGGGLRSSVNLV